MFSYFALQRDCSNSWRRSFSFIPEVYYFFCSKSFLKLPSQGAGISGIKIHRITRVHNRILRTRFDDKLDKILDKVDITELTKYEHFDIL